MVVDGGTVVVRGISKRSNNMPECGGNIPTIRTVTNAKDDCVTKNDFNDVSGAINTIADWLIGDIDGAEQYPDCTNVWLDDTGTLTDDPNQGCLHLGSVLGGRVKYANPISCVNVTEQVSTCTWLKPSATLSGHLEPSEDPYDQEVIAVSISSGNGQVCAFLISKPCPQPDLGNLGDIDFSTLDTDCDCGQQLVWSSTANSGNGGFVWFNPTDVSPKTFDGATYTVNQGEVHNGASITISKKGYYLIEFDSLLESPDADIQAYVTRSSTAGLFGLQTESITRSGNRGRSFPFCLEEGETLNVDIFVQTSSPNPVDVKLTSISANWIGGCCS